MKKVYEISTMATIFIASLVAPVASFVVIYPPATRNTPGKIAQQCNSVCLTTECVKTASDLLQDMNLTADPCDDFHEFTCGNWIKNHKR